MYKKKLTKEIYICEEISSRNLLINKQEEKNINLIYILYIYIFRFWFPFSNSSCICERQTCA
jgi:hypothetical protein